MPSAAHLSMFEWQQFRDENTIIPAHVKYPNINKNAINYKLTTVETMSSETDSSRSPVFSAATYAYSEEVNFFKLSNDLHN